MRLERAHFDPDQKSPNRQTNFASPSAAFSKRKREQLGAKNKLEKALLQKEQKIAMNPDRTGDL